MREGQNGMFGPTSVNGRFFAPWLWEEVDSFCNRENPQYHCRGIALLPCRSCKFFAEQKDPDTRNGT